MQLEAAIPHLDAGKLQRTTPEQRWIGLERLEITADRDRFREHRAVVENEAGQALHSEQTQKRRNKDQQQI